MSAYIYTRGVEGVCTVGIRIVLVSLNSRIRDVGRIRWDVWTDSGFNNENLVMDRQVMLICELTHSCVWGL